MTLSPQPYKGTRDYYPEEKIVQNYIFSVWRQTVEQFGFREYGTPLLEPLEVYTAKSGDELAGEQTYAFEDRGGRLVAIRPEMTPSVSRLVAAKRQETAYPARLYSIANFMRYERPQRGREREFWQLNVDTFGADGVAIEAETLQLAGDILAAFGATPDMYEIRINSRELVDEMTRTYLQLDTEQSKQLIRAIDRKQKVPEAAFWQTVADIVGADDTLERVRAILAATSISDLPQDLATSDAATRLKELFDLLSKLQVPSVRYDITLMRGLEYYTGMVFEVFDTDPENNRSLFGGGRYDGLVGLFGAQPIGAVGFAPGLTTTELFLRSHNLLPELTLGVDIYVAAVGDEIIGALDVAARLRSEGYSVETDTSGRKFDKLLAIADKKGAREIVFVGESELASGELSIRTIASGETRTITL